MCGTHKSVCCLLYMFVTMSDICLLYMCVMMSHMFYSTPTFRTARAATLRALHSTHMQELAPHHWCCYIDGQGVKLEGTSIYIEKQLLKTYIDTWFDALMLCGDLFFTWWLNHVQITRYQRQLAVITAQMSSRAQAVKKAYEMKY